MHLSLLKPLILTTLFFTSIYANVNCNQTYKVQSFIERFYTIVLERNADNRGLDYWTNNLTSGTLTGADVANGFIFSSEFIGKHKSTEAYITILYKAFFNRAASDDATGMNFWLNELDNGSSKEEVLHGFLYSTEFINLSTVYGIKAYEGAPFNSSTLTDFIKRFYLVVLGRKADAEGLNTWVTQLSTGIATGSDIAQGFIFSNEYNEASKNNNQYLNTLYRAFFNREPDIEGFNFWMEQLNQGVSRAEILQGFLHAPEFVSLTNTFGILAFEGASIAITSDNTAPVANAGVDQSISFTTPVTLSASNSTDSDGSIECSWWIEEGTLLSTDESFTKYNFPIGSHRVRLTVVDNKGTSSSDTVIITLKNTMIIPTPDPTPKPMKRIFILGSSTVHAGDYISGNFSDPYGSNRKLEGWGEQLKYYMKEPSKIYNRARSGSDSLTYRNPDPDRKNLSGFKNRDWGYTETLIKDTNDSNGGFLFIQFGANDSHHHIGTDVFQAQLEAYIADAKRLELTPVLISPPNNRNHYNSRPYAEYVEPVALDKNVLFLDLHQKSMEVWATYQINEDYDGDGIEDNPLFQTLPEADILYGYLEYHMGINNTHFSPIGANILAGWVKELACELDRDDAKILCSQFLENKKVPNEIPPVIALKGRATVNVNINTQYIEKGATASDNIAGDISTNIITTGSVDNHTIGTYIITYTISDSSGNEVSTTRTVNVIDPSVAVITVHEDAEDGDTVGWGTYGTGTNPVITNAADHGGHAIHLQGDDGLDNGFRYPSFTTSTEFVATWSLKYSEPFRLFILVHSTNSPDTNIYMEYTPENISRGVAGAYIHNGLGADANDSTWHTFNRDIEADFNTIYPEENLTEIVGFAIRGSGSIDDLGTFNRTALETFYYNGHTYKIVKTTSTWQDASTAAHDDGGYLANIESIAENHEVYSRLYHFIDKGEYASSIASNGGGATYIWIGANDLNEENTWVWENNTQQFWSGVSNGNAINGLYSNWGHNTAELQREPDNTSNQDTAGIALTEWQLGSGNLGQPSQWNDLIANDALYYIIEYDN